MTDRKVSAAKHLAASPRSDDRRQPILCSKRSDHLAGAQRTGARSARRTPSQLAEMLESMLTNLDRGAEAAPQLPRSVIGRQRSTSERPRR
jgi:hypothetical protein